MQKLFTQLGFIPIKIHFFQQLTFSFILGIICFNNYYYFLIIWPFLYLYRIIHLLLIKKENNNFDCFLIILIFFIGGLLIYNQKNNFKKFYDETKNESFDLIGTITDKCRIEHLNLKNCITFKIEKIKNKNSDEWKYCDQSINLYVNKSIGLTVDDLIRINDIQFKYNENEDFKKYLMKEGLVASLFLYNFSFKKYYRPFFSIRRFIHRIKNNLFYKLKTKMRPETFALFSSIFLGNKNLIKDLMHEPKDKFQIWGLSHYLARAGLHLTIIIAIWHVLMSLLQFSFKIMHAFTFILILIYHLLTWPSIPFVRSLFMFILYKICILFDLQINALHLLNITIFTILFFNPIQLFSLDFQLSFGITYGLIWLSYATLRNKMQK